MTSSDEASSNTTIDNWLSKFSGDHHLLMNDFKEGRPKLVVPENIDALRKLRMQYRHVTYHEIKALVKQANIRYYTNI